MKLDAKAELANSNVIADSALVFCLVKQISLATSAPETPVVLGQSIAGRWSDCGSTSGSAELWLGIGRSLIGLGLFLAKFFRVLL